MIRQKARSYKERMDEAQRAINHVAEGGKFIEHAKSIGVQPGLLSKWVMKFKKDSGDFEDGVLSAVKKPVENLNFSVALSLGDKIQSYDVVGSSGSTIATLKDLAVKKMLDDIEVKSVVLI